MVHKREDDPYFLYYRVMITVQPFDDNFCYNYIFIIERVVRR